MTFIARQEVFECENCHADVQPIQNGSYRNHCPMCLYSKHVDKDGPGDRLSNCKGLMKPVGLDHTAKKGFIIIHECLLCTKRQPNKSASDDHLENLDAFSEYLSS